MLENFNVAEDVVKTAANSAGSALKENEKYLDSINGKIAEFKATFEELSMTLIDSDFVKHSVGPSNITVPFFRKIERAQISLTEAAL